MKRTMVRPDLWVGKRVDATHWNIPDGYARCAMTGKLYRCSDLERSFNHHAFDRSFLIANHMYIEDADWLSDEGYDLLMDKLDTLGLIDAYREAMFNMNAICRGEYPTIGETQS